MPSNCTDIQKVIKKVPKDLPPYLNMLTTAEDPFVAISAGRSLFRVKDLLGLVRLVAEIKSSNSK